MKTRTFYRISSCMWDEKTQRLSIDSFQVIKESDHFVWLDNGKKCKKGAKRSFAHATKEEARKAFLARKKREQDILRFRLSSSEAQTKMANKMNLDFVRCNDCEGWCDCVTDCMKKNTENLEL